MRKLVILIFLLSSSGMWAQHYSNTHFGMNLGLFFNFGTHQKSLGLSTRIYYTSYFFQINMGNTITLNKASYGNRLNFWENRLYAGAVLMAGKRESILDFEFDGLNHQTKYNLGLAYNYILYFDNIGTTQISGAFGIHIKNFSLRFENDVFGGQARDRFRTGHLVAIYKQNMVKYSVGLYIWTGETRGSTWNKTSGSKMPNGYRDLSALPFGRTSHGILYGGILFNLPHGNTSHLRLGIDSEHVRHAFQNRFTHDLVLLPKSIERNTPHYPRLDSSGMPVFEKDLVRKNRYFMQFGLNDNWGN